MPEVDRFHKTADADGLKIEDLPLEEPGAGSIRLNLKGNTVVDDLSDILTARMIQIDPFDTSFAPIGTVFTGLIPLGGVKSARIEVLFCVGHKHPKHHGVTLPAQWV